MANIRKLASGGISGAAGGALTGASIGSVVPGIGTAIGALGGALLGGLGGSAPGIFEKSPEARQKEYMKRQKKDMNRKTGTMNPGELPTEQTGNFLTGYNPYASSISKLNPAQQVAQQDLLPYASERVKKAPSFEDIRQETLRNYQQQVLPSLINQFTQGTNAKASSPQFASMLRGGGDALQTKLNAQRADFELAQQQQAGNLLGTLLSPSQESKYNPAQPGFAQEFGGQVVRGLTDVGIGIGGDILRKWATATPQQKSQVIQRIESLSPSQKQQFAAFLQSPQAAQYPASIKNQISAALQPQTSALGTAGKVGLGLAAGALTAYGIKQGMDYLLGE